MRLPETINDLLRNPETPDWVIRDAVLETGGIVATAYIVYGESGEYSDHSNWTVAAFLDRSQAEAFRDKLQAWCEARYVSPTNYSWEMASELCEGEGTEFYNLKCPFDPNFRTDYTGTTYGVWELPLRAEG